MMCACQRVIADEKPTGSKPLTVATGYTASICTTSLLKNPTDKEALSVATAAT